MNKVTSKVLTLDEIDHIQNEIYELALTTSDIRAYAIMLSVVTGLRAGEVVALRWNDVKDGWIYVHRRQVLACDEGSEQKRYVEYSYDQGEHCDSHRDRAIPITPSVRFILDEIWKITGDGTYVIAEDGRWITQPSYVSYLKRQMGRLGYSISSNHPFRKALVHNILIPAGYDKAERALMLGTHANVNTTHYFR